MIPAAILVIVIALAIGLWLLFNHFNNESRDARLEKRVRDLEKKHDNLRALFEDVIVGHVNESRLRTALSRIFDKE